MKHTIEKSTWAGVARDESLVTQGIPTEGDRPKRLAFSSFFIPVDPAMAVALGGSDEAILVSGIDFRLRGPKHLLAKGPDGSYWCPGGYVDMQKKTFPFFTVRKVGTLVRDLELRGVIVSTVLGSNRYDHTKSYRIDYEVLDEIVRGSQEASELLAKEEAPPPTIRNTRCGKDGTYERPASDRRMFNNCTLVRTACEGTSIEEEPKTKGKESKEVGFKMIGGL